MILLDSLVNKKGERNNKYYNGWNFLDTSEYKVEETTYMLSHKKEKVFVNFTSKLNVALLKNENKK